MTLPSKENLRRAMFCAMTLSIFGLAPACDGGAEEAGESVDEATEEAGDALDEAADDVEEGVDDN